MYIQAVLTAVFLFPGNILHHINELLRDYNYAEVLYSSEEEEKTGDSRAKGTLSEYYIGKSSAPPEDSTTDCAVDRWENEHHRNFHGMLVLFQSEDEGEVLKLEDEAIKHCKRLSMKDPRCQIKLKIVEVEEVKQKVMSSICSSSTSFH